MKFLIRYHKTSGNNTYLTTDDTFSKKVAANYNISLT